ncbi:MAG: PTS sugar transporter subunit IIA [Verrucomicrobia bacterium]|nr:PTS sugar transporter subunit IIA [Verrucomicrobiota bacterium]
MIRVKAVLEPEHVLLDVPAANMLEAVEALAGSLRSDRRVVAWPEVAAAWRAKAEAAHTHLRHGVALLHARTRAVSDLVMAFGRLAAPIMDQGEPIRFVLLIGIPDTMDAEYARLVGALMRVLRDERLCAAFHKATRPEQVLAILDRGEAATGS